LSNAPTINGAALTTILQPLNDDLTTLSSGGTANCIWGEKSDSSGIECKTTLNLQLDDSAAQFKDATDATKTMQIELGSITTETKRTLTVPDASGTIALVKTEKLAVFNIPGTSDDNTVIDAYVPVSSTITGAVITTTGADYIEDAVGNDLGSFTGTAVTNQSIQVETPPTLTLTISSHTGAVVTSSPSGLNCGSTCNADFENGTVVTVGGYCLQNYATLAIGGDCNAETGAVTVNGAKSCTATCTKISPDVAIGSGAAVTLGSGAVGTLY
jgi:hypothetical protein